MKKILRDTCIIAALMILTVFTFSIMVVGFTVSLVVMLFGFIVGWFYVSNFWMVFIYVGIVAVVLYFLDFIRTEKDIRTINEMVRLSRDQQTGKNTEHKE